MSGTHQLLTRHTSSNQWIATATGVSVVAYSPTGRGLLTGRYVSHYRDDSREYVH